MTANEPTFDSRFLPHLCFVIGQLVTSNLSVEISQRAVDYVLEWVLTKPFKENESYESMVFLCLNFLNLKPAQIREYLLVKDVYYSFMMKIFQSKMSTKIHRKTAVIAMKNLISYEPEKGLAK